MTSSDSPDLLEISAGILEGRGSIDERHPLRLGLTTHLQEIVPGVAFVEAFGNVVAIAAGGELGLIDATGPLHADGLRTAVRSWNRDPLRSVVYTHGHVDHVAAVSNFEAEDAAPPVEVIGHRSVPARLDRYRLTHGYNAVINQRQFQLAAPFFPERFRYPDRLYDDTLEHGVGDIAITLRHDRGETDDGTWAWLPEQRVLCTGDLFIWASPNCGNPQKVQRYPLEWARALRTMADLKAEYLLPGHGLPIAGAARIAQVLNETAELLESLIQQTLDLMNQGARLNDVIHSVVAPPALLQRPWLQPVYDEPEFVVRNLWRLYGGWYDGNPANLKPAPESQLAAEFAELAGGPGRLAARAGELSGAGEHRLACHLAETAALAAPHDEAIAEIRQAVFAARNATERSTMAIGVFGWVAGPHGRVPSGSTEPSPARSKRQD